MLSEKAADNTDRRVMLFKKIIEADMHERFDVSTELHENIAQMMAAVRLHITLAKKSTMGEGLLFLYEAENILDEALTGVKTIAAAISPVTLKTLGITVLIEDLFVLLKEQKEINCTIDIDNEVIEAASLNMQNILYQLVQLQIIGILKNNSDATEVAVRIKQVNGKVQLLFEDNGMGTDAGKINFSDAFRAVLEKVEAFDGSFHIESKERKRGYKLEVLF